MRIFVLAAAVLGCAAPVELDPRVEHEVTFFAGARAALECSQTMKARRVNSPDAYADLVIDCLREREHMRSRARIGN